MWKDMISADPGPLTRLQRIFTKTCQTTLISILGQRAAALAPKSSFILKLSSHLFKESLQPQNPPGDSAWQVSPWSARRSLKPSLCLCWVTAMTSATRSFVMASWTGKTVSVEFMELESPVWAFFFFFGFHWSETEPKLILAKATLSWGHLTASGGFEQCTLWDF